ncbi:MAG TPA: serine hydrolase domain-containing protein [Gemmatimonadaceae bacterium]|nr:serine hydrolase domain-containing protein [Gemmatimonadaceae bacterium]
MSIIAGLVTCALPTRAPPVAAQSAEIARLIAKIEAPQVPNRQGYDAFTLAELMQRARVPGVSIAVIKDYRIHWAKGYGVADVETGRLIDTGTVFQAASISKPVFAMTVVKLAQDGKVSLDGDVNALLKSWRVPTSEHTRGQVVTLRSLLSHTSGADDGFGFPGYNPDEPRPTLVQILNGEKPSNVGPVTFARSPYSGAKYSGGAFTVAQLAIVEFIGRPLADFTHELLLGAIGMSRSSFEQPISETLAANAASAHNGAGRRNVAPWHIYPEQAAAGLWTTPGDLARFAIEVQRAIRGPKGAILTQTSAREMLMPIGTGGYAVGLGIAQRGQGWYFSHGGSNWGFQCLLVAHVRKGYGVVIMTNGDGGGQLLSEIEGRVAAAYGWDTLDKSIPR